MHLDFESEIRNVIRGDGTETHFGLNFGVGTEFAVGSVKLFAEAKYVTIFTPEKNTSYIPLTISVTL